MTPEQIAAQEALAKQNTNKAEEDYAKRLEAKRKLRASTSAEGIDNPFDVPERFRDPRFHYCIVNDKPGRISGLEARGYELVRDKALAAYLHLKEGEPIRFATGMDNPAWAYLMRIEEELFQEDHGSRRVFLLGGRRSKPLSRSLSALSGSNGTDTQHRQGCNDRHPPRPYAYRWSRKHGRSD